MPLVLLILESEKIRFLTVSSLDKKQQNPLLFKQRKKVTLTCFSKKKEKRVVMVES